MVFYLCVIYDWYLPLSLLRLWVTSAIEDNQINCCSGAVVEFLIFFFSS